MADQIMHVVPDVSYTSEQYTGRLRWRSGTLEQEVRTTFYNDDGNAMRTLTGWRVVPIVEDDAQP